MVQGRKEGGKMLRIRFPCRRQSVLTERLKNTRELRELIFGAKCQKQLAIILQCGIELQDSAVPSPDHDIFVLTRPNFAPEAGFSLPTTAVAFREPGRKVFRLDLPLNSSLESVEAALLAERTERHSWRQRQLPEDLNGTDDQPQGSGRSCTLIAGGKKMSNKYLLGDYLSMSSAAGISATLRKARRPAAPILVLWHPLQQGTPSKTSAAAILHPLQRRTPPSPMQCARAFSSISVVAGSQQGCGRGSRWRPRRSVQRQCRGVIKFSGLKRGARRGMGIQPLSS